MPSIPLKRGELLRNLPPSEGPYFALYLRLSMHLCGTILDALRKP